MAKKIAGLNLNLLHAFTLVAQHSSFRRAADESLRSQSALSAQIKELESQLGVHLFERTTRRVSLTPEGAELFEHAKRAFSELNIGLVSARKTADLRLEQVRFACLPAVLIGVFPSVLTKFEAKHPDTVVTALELHNEDVIDAVKSREVDFGVGTTVPASECEFDAVCQDEICAIVPLANEDHPEGVISMADLVSHTILMPRPAPNTQSALEREARFQKIPLNLRHQFGQPQSVASMVAEGHGTGLIAGILLAFTTYKDVRILRIANPSITREISIISRRGTSLSKHAKSLIMILTTALQEKTLNAKYATPSCH